MTLRVWNLALLLVIIGLGSAGCPDDDAGAPLGDSADGSTEQDAADTGGEDGVTNDAGADAAADSGTQPDTGPGTDAGQSATIELFADTTAGIRGLGTDSFELSMLDEKAAYAGTPGLQMEFGVRAVGVPKDAEVSLIIDGATVATATIIVSGDQGSAAFDAMDVAHGLHTVEARVTVAGELIDDVNELRVDVGGCDVTLAPLNDDCLTEDADPETEGFQASFTVTNPSRNCSAAQLEISGPAGLVKSELTTLDATGTAVITATLTPSVTPIDALDVAVRAIVSSPGAAEITGKTAAIPYTVDSNPPVLAITVPTGILTASNDEDPSDPDVDITVLGDVTGLLASEALSIELLVDGVSAGFATPTSNKKFQFKGVSLPEAGTYTLQVIGTESCGRTGTASKDVTVDFGSEPDPTADLVAVTATGDAGAGQAAFTLVAADEPAAFLATPGFQMEFRADTTNAPAGSEASLTLGGSTFEAPIGADGAATFPEVGLVKGEHVLTLTVTTPSGKSAEVSKTVTLDVQSCDVVLEPAGGGCLGEDSSPDAGFQALFVVRNPDGQCTNAFLTVVAADGGTTTTTPIALDESGTANITATLSAIAPVDGVIVNVAATVTSEADPGLAAQTSPIAYTLDDTAPEVTITEPAGELTLDAADLDGEAANGIQMVVAGTVTGIGTGDTDSIEIFVNEELQGTTTATGEGTYVFGITFPGAGTYDIDVRATDGCGNAGGQQQALLLLPTVVDVALVSPTSGTVLLAKDDADAGTSTVFEATFAVMADPAEPGATVMVQCRADADGSIFTVVGSRTLVPTDIEDAVAGTYDVDVALDTTVLGGSTMICRAVYMIDAIIAESAEIDLTVALPAPTLAVVAPQTGTLTNDPAVEVTLAATGLDGAIPEIRVTDADGAETDAAAAPGAFAGGQTTFIVTLGDGGALPDGEYTITFDAIDALGNRISELPAGGASFTVQLDRTAPTLELLAPPALLQPLLVVGHVDQDAGTPGYQTTVTVGFTAAEPSELLDVCLAVGGSEPTCQAPAAGTTEISFTGVTLVPGTNELQAAITDPAGNSAEAGLVTTLELDAPVVTITSPADGSYVITPTIDVVVTVVDTSGTPIVAASVDVLVGGASSGVPGTEGPDGTWTFSGVPVVPGPNSLQATASAAGKDGASGMVSVTMKDTKPSVSLTFPSDGAVFNTLSAACQAGVKDCIVGATATVENVADGVPATLTVSCGDSVVEETADVLAGAISWPGVTLLDQATCTLTASLTDLAGQPATSELATVTVDRVAPVLWQFTKPSDDVIQPPSDEDVLTPGIQKTVQVELSGIEAGQVVAVKVYPEGTDPDTVEASLFGTLAATVPDGTKGLTNTGVMSITTDGSYQLLANVADKAGNPAIEIGRILYVNVTSPIAAIVSPTNISHAPCTDNAQCAGGICHEGLCVIAWSNKTVREVLVQTQGVPFGTDNIRVCSENPDVAGPACATAGYSEVARGDVAAALVTLSLATTIDGLHHLIVEAETFPGNGDWVSSLETAGTGLMQRWVLIDTIAPVVTSIVSTSDTLPPTLALNQAEQVAPGTFLFAVEATDGGEPATGSVDIYSNAQSKGSLTMTSGAASGEVIFATDGVKKIQAVVSDPVGNTSLPITNAASVAVSYTVKVAPLTVQFTAPTKSPLLATDSLAVSLNSNQTGGTVSLLDGGIEVATKEVGSNGSVTFDHATYGILTDGSHTLSAVLTDVAGNTASATTSPATIAVDTDPPVIVVSAPIAGTLTDDDDAAPLQGGFQVAVSFATAGAASWKVLTQSGCAADFTGCGSSTERAAGPVTNPDGPEPTLTISLPITAAITHHRVLVRGTDTAGNATTTAVNLTVEISSCLVSFTNLPLDGVFNAADCEAPGCTSIARDVTVQYLGPCGTIDQITLLHDGAPIGQTSDLAGQEATFPIVLNDGETFTLWAEASASGGLVAETGHVDILVDLTAPTVAFESADVLGFTTPATGATELYGMASDQGPESQTTLEIHVRVAATDAAGGTITGITAVAAGGGSTSLAGPMDVVSSPFANDFKFLSLADQATYTITATIEDAAGNSAQTSFQATVDISPPEEVVIEPIDSAADVDPRLPAITLRWQPPASNTGGAGGAATAYDVRYSTQPIATDADFEEACLVTALPASDPVPAPGDPAGALDELTVRGPDPRSVNAEACKFAVQPGGEGYYFAMRAQDEAGNWSPVSGAGTAFTDAASLSYAKITHTLTAPSGNEVRLEDRVYGIGDINGDGFDDVALGGQAMSGFCIVYGHEAAGADPLADVALVASEGTHYQCIVSPTATGLGSPIIRAGDINGDGLMDLAVGEGNKAVAPAVPEAVYVYLGVAAGGTIDPTPVLTVKGTTNNNLYGPRTIASAGNFTGDETAGGLPVDDLIIPSGIGNKAFIVPGSEAFAPGTSTTVNVTSAADRTANDVVSVNMIGAQGNSFFGWAVAGAGDILPDDAATYDEVAISMAKDPAQIVVLRGRAVSGDTQIMLSNQGDGTQAGDASAVRLLPSSGVGTNTFGSDLTGGWDFDGAGTPDLVANHQYASATVGRFYLFYGEELVGKEGTKVFVQPSGPVTIDGAQAGVNGVQYQKQQNQVLPLGDFDGSGTVDLAYAVYSFTTYGKITVRLNHTSGEGIFEGLLPYEDIVIRDPYADPPSEKFGATWAPIGDFNGDGRTDMLIGTAGQGWAVLVY